MNILITGAAGFVGKNLTAALECIRDGRDRTHPGLTVGELYLYDIDSDPALLETVCQKADFVFNLAGVNRPKNQEEFMQGNFGFASTLLDTLKKYHNTCPVMLSSSIQATMVGRYAGSEYGRSKKAGEELFFSYAAETGAKVLVYRFPNLFGKWCRPNYNSAVATFCHNYAHDLPITVNDPGVELELLYIDDLVDEMIAALEGREHHCEFEGGHGSDGVRALLRRARHPPGDSGADRSAAGQLQGAAPDPADAGNSGRQLREKAVFYVSFLSAQGKGGVPPENER